MKEAKNALLGLAYNQFKDSKAKISAIDTLKSFIKQEGNKSEGEDWREAKLKGQIKRYLSGVDRERNDNATRYFLFTLMKSGTKHIEQCCQVYGWKDSLHHSTLKTINQRAELNLSL